MFGGSSNTFGNVQPQQQQQQQQNVTSNQAPFSFTPNFQPQQQQQQPTSTLGGSLFGASNTANSNQTPSMFGSQNSFGGGFGQSSQPQQTQNFGQQQNNGGLFGAAATTTNTTSSGNLFGAPQPQNQPTPQVCGFGQSTVANNQNFGTPQSAFGTSQPQNQSQQSIFFNQQSQNNNTVNNNGTGVFGASQPASFGGSQCAGFGAPSQPSLFANSIPPLFQAPPPSGFAAPSPLFGRADPNPPIFGHAFGGGWGNNRNIVKNEQIFDIQIVAVPNHQGIFGQQNFQLRIKTWNFEKNNLQHHNGGLFGFNQHNPTSDFMIELPIQALDVGKGLQITAQRDMRYDSVMPSQPIHDSIDLKVFKMSPGFNSGGLFGQQALASNSLAASTNIDIRCKSVSPYQPFPQPQQHAPVPLLFHNQPQNQPQPQNQANYNFNNPIPKQNDINITGQLGERGGVIVKQKEGARENIYEFMCTSVLVNNPNNESREQLRLRDYMAKKQAQNQPTSVPANQTVSSQVTNNAEAQITKDASNLQIDSDAKTVQPQQQTLEAQPQQKPESGVKQQEDTKPTPFSFGEAQNIFSGQSTSFSGTQQNFSVFGQVPAPSTKPLFGSNVSKTHIPQQSSSQNFPFGLGASNQPTFNFASTQATLSDSSKIFGNQPLFGAPKNPVNTSVFGDHPPQQLPPPPFGSIFSPSAKPENRKTTEDGSDDSENKE